MVVFGGALSLAREYLLTPIWRTVLERAIPWARETTEIVVAAHRFDSCVMGGVALVLHDVLSHPKLDVPVHHHAGKHMLDNKEVRPAI